MAWSIVGVGTVVEATTTAITLTEPAGVANGDLLIACFASRTTATTAVSNTGWTAVNSQNNSNTSATAGSAIGSGTMLYQVRAGTPDLSFVVPAGISVIRGQIVAYRGNLATTPLDVSTAGTTGAVTAVSVTGLTTTQADDLIVAMAAGGQEAAWSSFNATTPSGASGSTDTTTAPSATWRERAESVTTTGADTSIGIFDAVKTAAGATGNLTVTASIASGHVVIAGAFKILPPPVSTDDAWDVNDKSANVTLSNSDKTATLASGGAAGVRSTTKHLNATAGKYYAEFVTTNDSFNVIGIQDASAVINSILTDANMFGVDFSGQIYVDGTVVGSVGGSTFTGSNVVCVAWDAGTERVWFRKNAGNWNNNASHNPATGVSGFDVSFAAATDHALWFQSPVSGEVITLRTELAEFTQTVPSGFSPWVAAAGGGISVPVTGVSATGSVGSVTVIGKASTTVTGVQATGAVGDVTVAIRIPASVPVTGVQATGAVDSVTVVGKANVSTTGVAGTGSVNQVTIAGKANVAVTGIEAAGSTGSVSVAGKASASVTGVEATGSVGTVTITGKASVPVTGVEATGAVGSVTVATTTRVDVAAPVTGVQAAGQVGSVSVTGKAAATVTGVQATGAVGTITVVAGTGASVPVTGVSAAGQVGTATVVGKANAAVTGVQATGSVGSVTVVAGTGISVPVTGIAATGSVDSVSVTGKANVPLTGVTATGAVGGVSVTAGGSISTGVTGVQAAGSVGSVTVTANAAIAVPVTGVAAAASVGAVEVITEEVAEGLVGVWNGSAWVDKPAKVWTGSTWTQKPVKHWDGSAWV